MAQADYVTNAIRALITDASPKPSTNPVRAACAGLNSRLGGALPAYIPAQSYTVDLEDRADHLRKVLTPCRLTANLAGRINLRQVDSLLSDFAPDLTGTLQHAAVSIGSVEGLMSSDAQAFRSPLLHRRLGRPDHNGRRRKPHFSACGAKSAASSGRRTSLATSLSSSAW